MPSPSRFPLALAAILLLSLPACTRSAALQAALPAPAQTAVPISTELLVADMTQPHEARPSGVPDTLDWALGPRLGYGVAAPGDWRAFTAWGQVYVAEGGNPATNTRVQLRNLSALFLLKSTGQWAQVQTSASVDGAAYAEDFGDNRSQPADTRPEPGGGVSVTAGNGFNYHFWPTTGRAEMNPGDITGVLVTVEARLVLNDPGGPDDRAGARYLLGVGADYWRAPDSAWASDWSNNGDVGIGRHRFVGPEWQPFTMLALTADDVSADTLRELLGRNPPPLN